eukprot:3192046-Amphidinium_carterae.1
MAIAMKGRGFREGKSMSNQQVTSIAIAKLVSRGPLCTENQEPRTSRVANQKSTRQRTLPIHALSSYLILTMYSFAAA